MRIVALKGEGVIAPYVMEGFIAGFRELGHTVLEFDLSTQNPQQELLKACAFSPELAIGYHVTPLIEYAPDAYFFRKAGVRSVLLHFDAPFFNLPDKYLAEVTRHPEHYFQMIWDRKFLENARRSGLKNCHPVRLAVDPARFHPAVEGNRGTNGVGFVGSFASTGNLLPIPEYEPFISEVLDRKVQDLGAPVLDIVDAVLETGQHQSIETQYRMNSRAFWDIYYLIHCFGSLKARTEYVAAVTAPVDLYANCDPQLPGHTFRGPVAYRTALRDLYASYAVNLNISSLQLETSVNNRVFDCFASGGFLLSDYKEDMKEIFPDFWEEITFRNIEEMNRKIDYFLQHQKEREELTARAAQIVLDSHTYLNRAREILEMVNRSG